jgi:hypothetical protein
VQACAAGTAFFVLVSVWCNFDQWRVAGLVFVALPALVVSMSVALVMNLFEVFRPHARPDASRAIVNMRSGRLKFRFWGLALGVGLVLPLLFYLAAIIFQTDKFYTAIALLALAGLWFFEDVWVRAGQSVPLS